MLLFVMSRANTTNTSASSVLWSSGGTLVLVEFDSSTSAVTRYGGVELPDAFHATDIAISPYTTAAAVGQQRIIVSGYYSSTSSNVTSSNATTWELLETTLDTLRHNLNGTTFQLSSLASQASVCWPDFPSETSSVTYSSSASHACDYCLEASRVQFFDANTLIVAFRTVLENDADTVVMSLWNTTATSGASPNAAFTTACGASSSRVAYPARALAGDSRPTAIAIDYFAGIVYVASEVLNGDPSVLTKYLVATTTSTYTSRALTLNSVFDFASLFKTETVNQAEIIAAMVIAPGSRLLYASSSGIPQVKLASFLLYEIISVEPAIASVYGTVVTLHGRGFKASVNGGTAPTCFFDNATTPATVINATTATCVVANLSVTDASCSGQEVEISLFNANIGVTANLLTIQRAKIPSLTAVTPNRGNYSARALTVTGVDFVESTTALCRFTQVSSTGAAVGYTYATATFVTPSEMQCTQPPLTQLNYTLLDLTLDGQVYSPSISYVVCGPASRIRSSTMDTAVTVVASSSWISFNVAIETVDDTGNALGNLDLLRRSIVAPVSVQDPTDAEIAAYTFPACVTTERALWRSDGDGYPFPPCRDITLSNQSRAATFTTQTPVPRGYSLPNTSYVNALAFNQTSSAGTAYFQLYVYQPRAGAFSIKFIAALTTWSTSVFVVVSAGDPYALLIQNKAQRFGSTDYLTIPAKDTALSEIDIVVIDQFANSVEGDAAANMVVQADVYSYLFNCSYRQPTTQVFYSDCRVFRTTVTASFSRASSYVPFKDNIFLSNAVHGAYYYIMFQANSSGSPLVSVVTPPFQTDVCADNEYKVPNTTTCNPCPSPGGTCDGTEVIQVQVGYWRAPAVATHIYACDKLSTVCAGSNSSTWGSSCGNGASGILCSGCISVVNNDGSITFYGKSQLTDCEICGDQALNDSLFALLIIVAFILVVIWSFCTLRTEQQTDLSVVLRTVVNHMQATGELGQLSTKVGPFLKSVFSVSGGSSTFTIGTIQFFDCFQKQHGFPFQYFFYGIMCLPILAVPVALGVFAIIRTLDLKPLLGVELRKEIDLQEQQLGPSGAFVSLKTRYPFFMVAATTVSVIIFTVYQTLIAQSTGVLLCTNIVIGESFNSSTPAQSKYYLDDDMTIECDSNGNSPLLLAGQLFAIGYGFGIPLTFIFGYRFINGRLGMPALTNAIFLFLSGGYKAQYWFWQALIMIRKLLLVLVRVFIVDEQIQSAAGMWVMSLALALQLWLSPNENQDHNTVEAGSLAVITLTLNLGLIYFWPQLTDAGEVTLNVILITVTFVGFIMLVVYLIPALRDLAKEIYQDLKICVRKSQRNSEKAEEQRKKKKKRERAAYFNRHAANAETADIDLPDLEMSRGTGAVWRIGGTVSNEGGGEYEFEEMDAHAMLSLYDDSPEVDDDEMVEFGENIYAEMDKEY
ncbi:transmembrane protein, putative [Bodo saltans]|uniref:Transmembrane protein, putative n=1 Tax=Bodo saltans TaxID=75058 RepID=A0A0S4ITA3_BODSA|nr:transmembrane protein, putative [Bodo saltans]|eukprot:CUF41122.1 transmembrane protein, putative [Bodo saltans]